MFDRIQDVYTVDAGVVVHFFISKSLAVLVNIDVGRSKHVDLQSGFKPRNNQSERARQSIHMPKVSTGCLSHSDAVTCVAGMT